jgi:hypothetical protein
MSSLLLAQIPLKQTDGINPKAIAEWDKHLGYVIGIQVPDIQPDIVRLIEKSAFPNIPDALRGLADLVENWESTH